MMRINRLLHSGWLATGLVLLLANGNVHAQIGSWHLEDGSGQVVSDLLGPHNGVLGTTSAVEGSDPSWTSPGISGDALQFDGDDLVTIPDAAELQLTGDFTIWASFYIDAYNGDWVRVIGKMDSSGGRNYGLWYHPNGTALFQIYATGGNANAQINLPISIGQWYTMVGVREGNEIRLYLDGVKVDTSTISGTPKISNDPATIGKAPIHTGHIGRIDDVRIYDRAVSENEISDLGTRYCVGAPNSVGSGALIYALGSASVAVNNLTLLSTMIPDKPGIFFYGTTQVQMPYGHGFLCVHGQWNLLYPAQVGVQNQSLRTINFYALPASGQITAGSTWHFQHWYRDPAFGPPGYNASDAISITFTP